MTPSTPLTPTPVKGKTVFVAMDESLSSANSLKWALKNCLNDGDLCVVLSVVERKEDEYPRRERMNSLLSVIREPYSKGIRFSLRVISSDDVGFAIVEQTTRHHPSSLVLSHSLHSSLIGVSSYLYPEPQYAQTHSPLVSYLLENVPPSVPVLTVRYIPPEQVEDGADRRKKAESVWDL
ncbi:hypothetical protein HK097_010744 [Rhizophlyctis rosea]|uniref:UspA domain-containing protein n=1 Tax=Rhizophlyctis rosea TaxID=64517 RepID=A0AAD5S9J5_9FUNG|nr:hypothetical protein HK097_010744 [Rhizophlyctis rosea]